MKTDIVIPNPISDAAQQQAQKLGISLSEFYTSALAAYVAACQRNDVTEALNRVYEAEPSAMDQFLLKVQVASLGEEAW